MNYLLTNIKASVLYVLLACIPVFSVLANNLNLAVANSTCSAIKQVGELFQQRHDTSISYQCKSSGRLAKGLKGKTITADIYVSANRKWMDYMIANKLIKQAHVSSPWGNELVVATPEMSRVVLHKWSDLISDQVLTILIGDPGTAPFGRYAKQALQSTGLWEKVKIKIKTQKHISLLAETLANSDPQTVGILFASNVTENLKKIFTVDPSWHPPIQYYIASIKDSANRQLATDFLTFIQSNEAKEIFKTAKFKVGTQ